MSLGALGNGPRGADIFGSAFNFNQPHTSAFSSSNPFINDSRMSMAENSGAFTNANMEESVYAKVILSQLFQKYNTLLIDYSSIGHSTQTQ